MVSRYMQTESVSIILLVYALRKGGSANRKDPRTRDPSQSIVFEWVLEGPEWFTHSLLDLPLEVG